MYVTVDSSKAAISTREDISAIDQELLSAPSPLGLDKSVGRLIDGMIEGRVDILAIQSVEAVEELENIARRIGRRFGLVTGMRRVVKVCCDQSTADAVADLGMDADVVISAPESTVDWETTLESVSIDGMCVAVVSSDEIGLLLSASIAMRCRSLEKYMVA